ncbi:MAG: hypothetical protein ACTSVY_12065 [Candidatus Helarchaeota archaeon]
MDQIKFEKICEEILPACVVFLNPLKQGNSPESDDEFDSIFAYIPKYFDVKRIPIHVNIQNAFRVSFVDGDWLELGKDIFITRRKLGNNRLTILTVMNFLDELQLLEINIKRLIKELYPTYEFPRRYRFKLKMKEPKIFIGTNSGICVLTIPQTGGNDQLIYGFLESLKDFGNEMVLNKIMNDSIDEVDLNKKSDEVKISNKLLEIQSSVPIDDNLNLSIIHFNPDDIYDEINKRTIDVVRTFVRATLRRTGFLNKRFLGRTDIYEKAFRKPIYGGVSSEYLLNRAQNYGDEILIHHLLSETFREITLYLKYSSDFEVFLLNSLNANVIALDFQHTKINDEDLIEIKPSFIESLQIYRSKLNRVVSSKVINSSLLDFGKKKCRMFPLMSFMKFNEIEISPSMIEACFCFIGDWKTISENHKENKTLISVLENGILQLSDPIHIRPNIDERGMRTSRIIKINNERIQLPDFSLLTTKTRKKFRMYLHERISDIVKSPLETMLQVINLIKLDLKNT